MTLLNTHTVLIVEDEAFLRIIGASILEEGGFRVIEAANAEQALHCLECSDDILVMFTDINMPGSPDGLGLARLVNERWPSIGILVTSGQEQPCPEELPLNGRFLSKPYRDDEMLATVRSLAAR